MRYSPSGKISAIYLDALTRADVVGDVSVSASGGDAAKSTASSESFSGDVEFSSADDKTTGPADAA